MAADPFNFLGLAKTLDEHAKDGEEAIKPFPVCLTCVKDDGLNDDWILLGDPPHQTCVCRAHGRHHKPYFRPLTLEWLHSPEQSEGIVLMEKSRQLMATWTFVLLHLWLTLTRPGSLVAFQSLNYDKACELIDRAAVSYSTFPRELQRFGPLSDAPRAKARRVRGLLEFPDIHSRLMAIPNGANQVRMYTLTALFMDESAFWMPDEDFEDSYSAALATIKGGGRLTAISTVNHPGCYFHKLVHGQAA